MINDDMHPEEAVRLRRQAYDIFRDKTVVLPENFSEMSHEEIRQAIHELQVHRIELQMQNEDMRTLQAELELTRAHYFDLYDRAPVGYCTLSENGLILESNLATANLLGVPRNDLIRQPITRFIRPEDQTTYYLHCKQLSKTAKSPACELGIVKQNGTAFWARLEVSEARDADGSCVRWVVISDITGNKQALQESESRLRLALNAANAGAWEWDLRSNENVWSDELYELYDLDPAIDRASYDGWRQSIVPEHRGAVEKAVQDAVWGGTELNIEWRVNTKDASMRWLMSRGQPELDLNGQPVRYRGIVIDITHRKQTEAELIESEKKYRQVVDAMHETLSVIDGEGVFLFANEKAAKNMCGGKPEDLFGKNIRDLVPAAQAGQLVESYKTVIATGQPFQREVMMDLAGGHKWFWNTLMPIRFGPGQTNAVLSLSLDITDRKHADAEREKLQAQLLQAQKMESVGRLAGGVAHDFNNMLGVIIGNAEMALEDVDPGSRLHADLVEIRNAAQRSVDITKQLLAFARKQPIAPRILDLNEIVEGMLKMLRRLIGEDIDLAWLPGKSLWPVRMDPTQIDQMLANLCVNARDAIPDVGNITIETANTTFDTPCCIDHLESAVGDYVMLAISDTGCGMDSLTREKIFEPFFTTKEIGKGTGLGLATVYGIVRQNDGFIHVYSEPGQGTTLKIYLKRHTGKSGQLQKENEIQRLPLGHETILLVEDELKILNMASMMLKRLGYSVLGANTPDEAMGLATAHSGDIHLLVTDVVMPGMNGRDLADRLMSNFSGMKCLFMSGYTADVIAHHGVLNPGVQFIQKPFSMMELAKKVREALGKG